MKSRLPAKRSSVLADRVERLRHGDVPYWDQVEIFEAKRLARQLEHRRKARRRDVRPPARSRYSSRSTTASPRLRRSSLPAWPGENGGNGSGNGSGYANGNGHGKGNGNANGNGSHGPLVLERPENGAARELRATRRMPLPEQRLPQRPPPRDPDEGGLGPALGGLRPSGGAVRRALYWLIGGAIVVGTFVYAPRLAAPDIDVAGPTDDRLGMADADVLNFFVTSAAVANARWSVDGKELGEEAVEENVARKGLTSTFTAVALPEGDHTVAVEVPGPDSRRDREARMELLRRPDAAARSSWPRTRARPTGASPSRSRARSARRRRCGSTGGSPRSTRASSLSASRRRHVARSRSARPTRRATSPSSQLSSTSSRASRRPPCAPCTSPSGPGSTTGPRS